MGMRAMHAHNKIALQVGAGDAILRINYKRLREPNGKSQ
jgi:hypothetical protein